MVFLFEKKKRLKKFIKNKKYPNGTLFLANYKANGQLDYGHIAMVINAKENKIIHCYNDFNLESKHDSGVIIEDFEKSNSLFGGNYYSHICYPKDWILIS